MAEVIGIGINQSCSRAVGGINAEGVAKSKLKGGYMHSVQWARFFAFFLVFIGVGIAKAANIASPAPTPQLQTTTTSAAQPATVMWQTRNEGENCFVSNNPSGVHDANVMAIFSPEKSMLYLAWRGQPTEQLIEVTAGEAKIFSGSQPVKNKSNVVVEFSERAKLLDALYSGKPLKVTVNGAALVVSLNGIETTKVELGSCLKKLPTVYTVKPKT